MNNIETFLSMNHQKSKDVEIQSEIDEALLMQNSEHLKDQPETELTTSSSYSMELLKQMMESGPRKLKRKLIGKENTFGNTLMARFKRKNDENKGSN